MLFTAFPLLTVKRILMQGIALNYGMKSVINESVLYPHGRTNADVCVDNDAAIGVDVAVVEHKGGAV